MKHWSRTHFGELAQQRSSADFPLKTPLRILICKLPTTNICVALLPTILGKIVE
ncbi:hypothetical protein PLANPX_4762 [Lacipirellula parvula]|uniref:Uncharacterized protein n=1 Tax=Lacipirellula parvula TaxID=2650471 RepID=A0A5K7XED1_9BACT|nr:hypothetical protein PLANPX_4762 [Lacipirellula parvula]